MGQSLHVLIVEDSETDTELVLQKLREGGFEPDYKRVDRPEAFKKALEQDQWDLIISDYVMPHFSEPAVMELLKKSQKDIPLIVISGKIGEDTAVDTMKLGANDYVMKDKLARLVPAVVRELKEAQEREAKRLAEQELENFINSLTHDLKTPILAECRILELITSGSFGSLSPQLKEVHNELINSNQFMQHMVNNILYAYRYKQGKVQLESVPTELVNFISSYVSSVAVQTLLKPKALKVVVESVDSLPMVNIDQHEIRRVLNNILKNAIDHSPYGSTIRIDMQAKSRFVRIGIRDYGPGIAPEIEPYLFTPYTTSCARKYHQVGLGLGLYLSKRIIEAHEGTIGYENKPGESCLFYFDLPIAVDAES